MGRTVASRPRECAAPAESSLCARRGSDGRSHRTATICRLLPSRLPTCQVTPQVVPSDWRAFAQELHNVVKVEFVIVHRVHSTLTRTKAYVAAHQAARSGRTTNYAESFQIIRENGVLSGSITDNFEISVLSGTHPDNDAIDVRRAPYS